MVSMSAYTLLVQLPALGALALLWAVAWRRG